MKIWLVEKSQGETRQRALPQNDVYFQDQLLNN